MSEQKYIYELHNDHKMWLSELTLAQDEMKSFGNRLQEIASANTGSEVMSQVEQFQNQFIRENEVVDILKHDIHHAEVSITENISSNTVAVDHRKVSDNAELRDRMTTFHKIFTDLKQEFMAFLAKTL